MEQQDVETIVRDIISGVSDVPPEQITQDADLAALGVDSLMALAIIAKAEKRFKFQIPEQQLRGLKTLRQIVALFEKTGFKVMPLR